MINLLLMNFPFACLFRTTFQRPKHGRPVPSGLQRVHSRGGALLLQHREHRQPGHASIADQPPRKHLQPTYLDIAARNAAVAADIARLPDRSHPCWSNRHELHRANPRHFSNHCGHGCQLPTASPSAVLASGNTGFRYHTCNHFTSPATVRAVASGGSQPLQHEHCYHNSCSGYSRWDFRNSTRGRDHAGTPATGTSGWTIPEPLHSRVRAERSRANLTNHLPCLAGTSASACGITKDLHTGSHSCTNPRQCAATGNCRSSANLGRRSRPRSCYSPHQSGTADCPTATWPTKNGTPNRQRARTS